MDINIWNILDEELKSSPTSFGVPVRDRNIIDQSQKELDVIFSDSYLTFLEKYGGHIIEGHIILGLIGEPKSGYLNDTIMRQTHFFKQVQKWPEIEDWYIVSDDGSGNPIGIDPLGQVWLSDHDSGFEHIKLADTFEEFLVKLYTDTIYQ